MSENYQTVLNHLLFHKALISETEGGQRINRYLGHQPEPRTPRAMLRAVLAALLPMDEDSRTEALVANAFFIRALKDSAVAARFREGWQRLKDAVKPSYMVDMR